MAEKEGLQMALAALQARHQADQDTAGQEVDRLQKVHPYSPCPMMICCQPRFLTARMVACACTGLDFCMQTHVSSMHTTSLARIGELCALEESVSSVGT